MSRWHGRGAYDYETAVEVTKAKSRKLSRGALFLIFALPATLALFAIWIT